MISVTLNPYLESQLAMRSRSELTGFEFRTQAIQISQPLVAT
jgi:hypothetical protein